MMLHHRKVLEFRPGKGYPEHEVHFSFMDPVKYEIRFLFCWLLENLVPDVWPMPGTCNGPLWCVCTWYSFPPGFILWAYLCFVFLSLDWLWISAAIILYFVYSFFFGFHNLLYIRVTLESLFRHSLLVPPLRVSGLFDLAWGPRIWISNKFPGDVDIASPGATLGDPLLQAWIPWNLETKEDLFAFISLYLKYLWLVSQMDIYKKKTIQIWLKKEREN